MHPDSDVQTQRVNRTSTALRPLFGAECGPLINHAVPPSGADSNAPSAAHITPYTQPPPQKSPNRDWPAPIAVEAYHGLAGDIVRLLEPHTEADPVALLVQFLVMFGNVIGRNSHHTIEGTPHHPNLFAALVGSTSSGRKGTSYGRVKPVYELLDKDWLRHRNIGGISSAEGLLYQVRDANEKLEDEGEPDKRVMLTEPEFANVLKQGERQGNTVSIYLRQLWDGLPVVQTLTKNLPVKATDAHASLIGHITPEELHRCLTATETANGFANRFLFVCVTRSKSLPFGGDALDPLVLVDLQHSLDHAAGFAQTAGRIEWHPSARPLWEVVYPILTSERHGLAGAMTARAAPITLRLAMLFALLDRSHFIRPRHLMAGLAVWDYCERSVIHLFGDKTGNPLADEIRELLRNAPAGLTRSELNRAMGNHTYGDKLSTALNALQSANLARCEHQQTGGRPAEKWYAASQAAMESPLLETARKAFAECVESVPSVPVGPTPFLRFARFERSVGTAPALFVSGSAPPHTPPPPTPAELWLVNVLRSGPRLKSDIDKLAKDAGIPGVKAAVKQLRIEITQGRSNEWLWSLPVGFDLSRFPAPPDPPAPTLLDDIPTPPELTLAGKKPETKRGNTSKDGTATNATLQAARLQQEADRVAVMLRKAKRSWSEVAVHLDQLDEYYPPDLEVHGLTGPQLALVSNWLADGRTP